MMDCERLQVHVMTIRYLCRYQGLRCVWFRLLHAVRLHSGTMRRKSQAGEWREAPGLADAFRVGNENGEGVLATLDKPHEITLGERQEFRGGQAILPLRIMLPAAMEPGEKASLRITLRPASAHKR